MKGMGIIMNGTVFNIQKFSINDGPGIRTTVFIKGCPLRCAWCHNPESNNTLPEIMYDERKCTSCARCAEACPYGCHTFENGKHIFNRENCILCGKCVNACYAEALEMAGKTMSAEEVIEEVMKDKSFYETSGGGITLSGGEPMMHFHFTNEVLSLAKERGLHTAIETCGFAPEHKYREVAKVTDLFLYDWKVTNSELHEEYTGVSNDLILSNLKMLNDIGAKIILRCPIIPTINDTDEHFKGIADIANSLENVIEINIEPYHPLGESKNEKLGRESVISGIKMPENETVEEWIHKLSKLTDTPVKKG